MSCLRCGGTGIRDGGQVPPVVVACDQCLETDNVCPSCGEDPSTVPDKEVPAVELFWENGDPCPHCGFKIEE